MKVGKWDEAEDEKIMIDIREVESVDAFCYMGSLMAADSTCDREIKYAYMQEGKMLLLENFAESGSKTDVALRLRYDYIMPSLLASCPRLDYPSRQRISDG